MSVQTIWGPSQSEKRIAPGITYYETAAHGGYRLSADRFKLMPERYRSIATHEGHEGWYEQDCDWALVALSFPDCFSLDEVVRARRIFETEFAPGYRRARHLAQNQ